MKTINKTCNSSPLYIGNILDRWPKTMCVYSFYFVTQILLNMTKLWGDHATYTCNITWL